MWATGISPTQSGLDVPSRHTAPTHTPCLARGPIQPVPNDITHHPSAPLDKATTRQRRGGEMAGHLSALPRQTPQTAVFRRSNGHWTTRWSQSSSHVVTGLVGPAIPSDDERPLKRSSDPSRSFHHFPNPRMVLLDVEITFPMDQGIQDDWGPEGLRRGRRPRHTSTQRPRLTAAWARRGESGLLFESLWPQVSPWQTSSDHEAKLPPVEFALRPAKLQPAPPR